MWDIAIIGAGVIGCNIARELSKYNMNICVLERTSDVASGTTKANSAIVHAGYDAKYGTLKGKLNAVGNEMYERLSKELDFPFKRNGSLVVCFEEDKIHELHELKANGEKNNIPGLEILNQEGLRNLEPNIGLQAVAALYAPTGGIVCPYEMTVALAENAYNNGIKFQFDTEVKNITKEDNYFTLTTSQGEVKAKIIINAAGLFADRLNNMISTRKIEIRPRKGEYCLFDKAVGGVFTRTIFQQPTIMGKGVLVTPTVDGNLLVGPNATDIDDKEDITTTQEGLDEILDKAQLTLSKIPYGGIITSFSGLRARGTEGDFIIGEAVDVPGFINVACIESPGLSASPAIAVMVEEMIVNKVAPAKKENYDPVRKGIPKFREMTDREREEIIKKDPRYGRIVCRCETVTEGEIVESIHRPLGAKDLDGVKRRTRAGMGRCQAGFCTPKIVDILAKELKKSPLEVTKFGGNSNLLVGYNKHIEHKEGGK